MNAITTIAPTMTSREIADLVESNHPDVKRSIDRLAAKGVISIPPSAGYLDSLGRAGHTVNEHSFTAWLVDRWFMYRKKAAPGKLGHLTPAAQHEAAGRFDTKTGQGHGGINVPVHKFTGNGVEWIAGEWAKHQIRGAA